MADRAHRGDQDGRSDEPLPGGSQPLPGIPGGFQPADAVDLERFPPRGEVCRSVRHALRDYCDDELEAGLRQQIDEHVHLCRDCALAMSRMELEVLRLRQAFDVERREAFDLPADLLAGVMRRLGDELLGDELLGDELLGEGARDGDPPGATRADPQLPPQFTRRVMDRVRREWPRRRRLGGMFEAARSLAGPRKARGLAVLAVVLAFTVALAVGSWAGQERAETVRFEVVAAADAILDRGEGRAEPARVGRSLHPGEVLRADGLQAVELLRIDPRGADPAGPRSAVRDVRAVLDPGSACRARPDGGIDLLAGSILIESAGGGALASGGASSGARGAARESGDGRERAFSLTLPDGLEVRFGAGTALVSVESVIAHDRALAPRASFRTRVEVASGQVEVLRGRAAPVPVPAGRVARFEPRAVVEFEAAPTADLLARSARGGRATAVSPALADAAGSGEALIWTGRVVDAATGRGVGGAAVEVRVDAGPVQTAPTDADGWFRFTANGQTASTAIVRVVPPVVPPVEAEAGWASFGPEPLPLVAGSARSRRLAPIALGPDVPIRGLVSNAAGGRVPGARVVPYVLDDLFAVAERLEMLAVVTDADGRFALRGLPAELPRHQTLALLVEKEGQPRHLGLQAGAARAAAAAATVDIALPAPRDLLVAGLTPDREARVLREIPGVALETMTEEFRLRADAGGQALLHGIGPGALWLVDEAADGLRPLVASAVAGAVEVSPADGAMRSASVCARLRSESRGFRDHSAPLAMVAAGRRYDRAAVALGSGAASYLSVRDPQRGGAEAARVFLAAADGALTYLGEADAMGGLAFEEPAVRPFQLVAVGADGAIGVVTDADWDAEPGRIELAEPGTVSLADGAPRQAIAAGAKLGFEAVGGPFAGRRFWRVVGADAGFVATGLPSGSYRVVLPDGTRWHCEVRSGETVRLVAMATTAGSGEGR
jgi:hypothetical protein